MFSILLTLAALAADPAQPPAAVPVYYAQDSTPGVPWYLEPQFLAAVMAVGLLLLRYFGVIKDPDKPSTPPNTTPPTDPPETTIDPVTTTQPAIPGQTIMQFLKELLADGTISWTDVPAVIAFLTKILGNRLTLGPDAKLAAIQFIANRKTGESA